VKPRAVCKPPVYQRTWQAGRRPIRIQGQSQKLLSSAGMPRPQQTAHPSESSTHHLERRTHSRSFIRLVPDLGAMRSSSRLSAIMTSGIPSASFLHLNERESYQSTVKKPNQTKVLISIHGRPRCVDGEPADRQRRSQEHLVVCHRKFSEITGKRSLLRHICKYATLLRTALLCSPCTAPWRLPSICVCTRRCGPIPPPFPPGLTCSVPPRRCVALYIAPAVLTCSDGLWHRHHHVHRLS
jgi:hypothetical protein